MKVPVRMPALRSRRLWSSGRRTRAWSPLRYTRPSSRRHRSSSGMVARAPPFEGKLEPGGGGRGDAVGGRDGSVEIEEDARRDLVRLDPPARRLPALLDVDEEDAESPRAELLLHLLDRRGQLPRAERSPGGPEVEEDGLAPVFVERDLLAVQALEPEGGRVLAQQRDDLEVEEEVLHVRRLGPDRDRETGHPEGADPDPARAHAQRTFTRGRGSSFTRLMERRWSATRSKAGGPSASLTLAQPVAFTPLSLSCG